MDLVLLIIVLLYLLKFVYEVLSLLKTCAIPKKNFKLNRINMYLKFYKKYSEILKQL